jgi:DNA-binding transcriptional MerR regulator
MAMGLLIGELAGRVGVAAPTIRYYESIGLLRPPARTPGGYRRYPERTIEDLVFIRKAQALGFTLDEVAEILALTRAGTAPCARVLAMTERHLAALDERIERTRQFRDRLAAELARWRRLPAQSPGAPCQMIAGSALAAPDSVPIGGGAIPGVKRRARARR